MENLKVISVVVSDEPSAIERVLGCLSAQGLDSNDVTINRTFDDKIVVNIALQLEENKVKKVLNKLEKLVPVYSANKLDANNLLSQQLALIKFNTSKISNDLLSYIINNSNISIILPFGAESDKNYTSDVSNFRKNYNNIIIRVVEKKDFIDGFINDHKNAIVDIVRTNDLSIAIK